FTSSQEAIGGRSISGVAKRSSNWRRTISGVWWILSCSSRKASSACDCRFEPLLAPRARELKLPLPVANFQKHRGVSEVELQGRHRDVAFAEHGYVAIGVRLGAVEAWFGLEVNAAARIDAAIEHLDVGRHVLRHHADATHRALLQAGNVDIE